MDNLICIPTGKKLEELIQNGKVDIKKYFSRFNLDGLELTMVKKEMTYALKLSKEDKNWIKDLDYVSIHGPVYINKDSKKEQIKQLDALYNLYDKVNAKNMLFHVSECPYDLIDNYSWKVILENMSKTETVNNKKLTDIFVKTKYGFCLDTTHAYTHGKSEISRLYNLLEPKLKQIHFSAAFGQKKHRKISTATKSFMNSVKPVLKSNVPLILEINKIDWNNAKEVNNEINFVRNLFN
jgi:hypothetical protein